MATRLGFARDFQGGGSPFGGGGRAGNIMGNTGYSVIQPNPGGSFQVVQPQVVPTSRSGTSAERSSRTLNRNRTQNLRQNRRQERNLRETVDRFDPQSRLAYTELLRQLQGGGTEFQQEGMAALQALLGRSAALEEEFTPDAARAQAQQALPQYARQLREGIMPAVYSAQEGAGLSGDALTALLAQDQATRVADAAAAAELDAILSFGELGQGQQQITGDVAGLIAADPVQAALQSLLEIGSGAYEQRDINEVIDELLTQSLQESLQETETGRTASTVNERTQYQAFGGGQGGRGGGGGRVSPFGSASSGGGARSQERLATLLASLGPFQNLQDVNYAFGSAGGPGPLSEARRESGRSILELAERLGVRL